MNVCSGETLTIRSCANPWRFCVESVVDETDSLTNRKEAIALESDQPGFDSWLSSFLIT